MDSKNEWMINEIFKYIDVLCKIRSKKISRKEMMFDSYSIWAANEIVSRMIEEVFSVPKYIYGEEEKPLKNVILDFINELEDSESNKNNKILYEIAIDTAIDILDLFDERGLLNED